MRVIVLFYYNYTSTIKPANLSWYIIDMNLSAWFILSEPRKKCRVNEKRQMHFAVDWLIGYINACLMNRQTNKAHQGKMYLLFVLSSFFDHKKTYNCRHTNRLLSVCWRMMDGLRPFLSILLSLSPFSYINNSNCASFLAIFILLDTQFFFTKV